MTVYAIFAVALYDLFTIDMLEVSYSLNEKVVNVIGEKMGL